MRKNHFDMMSMMSPKGWLGGSDKSSGKLFRQKFALKNAKFEVFAIELMNIH